MLHAQNPFLNGNNHPFASLFNGAQQPSHPYARPTRGGFPYSDYYCQQPTRSSIPLCRHCGEAHDPRDHFYDPSSSRSAYHHPSFYDAPDEEEDDATDTWTRARQRQIYEERLRQAELEKARRLAMQQEGQQQYIDALRRQQQEEDEARMRYLQQRQAALEEYRRRRDEEEQLRVQATEEARKQQERRRRQAEEEQARQQRLQRLSYIRQNVAARTIQRFMRTATLLRCVNAIARRFKELKEAFVFPASIDLQDNAAAAAAEPKLAYTQNNYAIHAFDDALSKLLVQLDGVESFGILAVRERRKQVVRMIESEAQALEERWKAAAKAQQQQQQQQQQAEVDEEEEIRNDETAGVPSSAESVETAEDVVEEEEDHRMNTDEDGAVVPASAEQPSISESTATLSADPIVDDIVPEPTTITHESSVAAGEPTHEHEHEHTGEPTSTPIDEEVDPDEDEKSMILERTTTATSSSLSLPTHSDAHLTGTTESSTEPTEPTSIIISTSASTSITPESSATVAVNGGPVDGVLTHFDDDEPHDGLLLSSSSLPIFTPTPTTSALPIPDAPSSSSSSSSSTPHLSPSPDIPFIAEDEDNEDEEIEEVDRALAITPLGAEYTSTEEEEREGEEEEETWEDAWEELMPLDGDLDGVSARFSSTSSAAAAAIAMHQPESANEETWSTTSSEKAQEQTRISLLPASKDGEEPEGAEDFEMV